MRFTSKIIMITMFVGMMIWIGTAAGRWAEKQSQVCEDSYQKAINTLRSK